MKLVVLGDSFVGLEIIKFLHESYKSDLVAVVCKQNNEMFNYCNVYSIDCTVCDDKTMLESALDCYEFDLGI